MRAGVFLGQARRRWTLLAAMVCIAGGTGRGATYRAGEWPVEVTVTPDEPVIVVGQPVWLSFSVTNLSSVPLQILAGGDYQNDLGRPASFIVRVIGNDGRWIETPDAGGGTGGLIGPQDLPAGGSHVFRLFLPHWAKLTEAGSYTIVCRRTLQLLRPATDGAFARQPTSDVPVEVRASLGVLPRDELKLKAVIDELGERMLAAHGDASGDEAVIALSWIDDARVVPWFSRALQLRSYALKFVAVQMLARFDTEEALGGLRAAVAAAPADFDAISEEKASGLAARIRAAAVSALGRSKQPRARELVIAQRSDPAESVRLSVVRAFGRFPPAQALPLLEEMAKDRSPAVRDEAQRAAAAVRAAGAPKNG